MSSVGVAAGGGDKTASVEREHIGVDGARDGRVPVRCGQRVGVAAGRAQR